MKVALYARVSTSDQSPEMQLRELREYAKQRGFEVYEEYVDVGISGSKSSRPQLDKLMAAARKRKFKGILVWRFDRFARSSKHLVNALSEFKELGITFMSYNENIDTSSALGEAIFTIIGAMAQLERDIIRERVNAGLANAKAKGKKLGRPGINAATKSFIEQMRYNEKWPVSRIAERLDISERSVWRVLGREA